MCVEERKSDARGEEEGDLELGRVFDGVALLKRSDSMEVLAGKSFWLG